MPQDSTEDHVALLLRQNKITHIIMGSGERPVTGTALVQRCLSAGIENPLPLPDGTVAVHMPGGVPDALVALELSAYEIDSQPDRPPAPAQQSDHARLAAIDAAIQELEARIGRDLAAVKEQSPAMPPPASTPERVSEGETPDAASAPLLLTPDETATEAGLDDANIEPPAVSEETFELSFLPDSPAPVDHGNGEAEEVWPETAAPDDMSDAPGSVPEATDIADDAPAAPDGPAESVGAADHAAELAPLADRLALIEDALAEQALRVTELTASITALADRPTPRPDLSEANRAFARFSTAFAHAISRLERVSDGLEALAPSDGSGSGSDATGMGEALSELAAAIVSASDKTSPGPDLGHLVSLQTVMIRQLAAILDAQHPKPSDTVAEFLTDLRHSVAEIVMREAQAVRAS